MRHQHPDPRRRIANSPLATFSFGALIAVLVGFAGASTYLSIANFGADPEVQKPKTPLASLQQPRSDKAVQPAASSTGTPDPAPSEQASPPEPNPTGVAAAAKAKARAEMDAMANTADEQAEPREMPRRYRAPQSDKHRIY